VQSITQRTRRHGWVLRITMGLQYQFTRCVCWYEFNLLAINATRCLFVYFAAGLLFHKPRLIDIAIGMICFAHLSWWIDVAAYLVIGRMPLGARETLGPATHKHTDARMHTGRGTYMLWETTTWHENASSLHHAW
jgi:hypothetical protein